MRFAPIAFALTLTGSAFAAESDEPVACAMHADVTHAEVRVLGRLNVNTATRDELALVPALDDSEIDALLGARARGLVTTLATFDLSDDVLARLTTSGPSTLHRIRALPLEVLAPPRPAAALH